MELMPVEFKFERRSIIPILRVTGMVNSMPQIQTDRILLHYTLKVISKAEKFNGKLMEYEKVEDMSDVPKNKDAARIYIIFKNEDDFEKAVSSFQKGLE